MADSVFKTPYGGDTPRPRRNDKFYTPKKIHSDSEESISSTDGGTSNENSSDSNLSLVAEYDEITRFFRTLKSQYCHLEKSYIDFVESSKGLYLNFKRSREECLRLQSRLEVMAQDNSDLEGKLALARKLLDKEKKNTKRAERDRNNLELQIEQVKDSILRNRDARGVLPDYAMERIAFLETDRVDEEQAPQLSCIPEVNSTGSILSDFSYSKSEDDLDTSKFTAGKSWKKHRPSAGVAPEQPAMKKRRSSGNKVVEISTTDTVRATTTLSMPKHGPITATSVIEAVPFAPSAPSVSQVFAPSAPPPGTPQSIKSVESYNQLQEPTLPAEMIFQSWSRREGPPKPSRLNLDGKERRETRNNNNNNNNVFNQKEHQLQKKTVVLPENCSICQKKLRFGRMAWKCKDCKSICHEDCKEKLAMPCIPVIHTPNQRNGLGVIGDYTGTTPPMVPALIIHCVNEIEMREPKELGLYRVPGSEKDVKSLKERFLKGKAAPCLNDVDVHILCGVVKDFLRSLQDPLVTTSLRKHFVLASEQNNTQMLLEKISELPQPNRDTLAYMMLHLKRISEIEEVKMPVDNLAKAFGPTMIGYSSDDLDRDRLINETRQQIELMKFLIGLPSAHWEAYINVHHNYGSKRLQQTPSTDSLLLRSTKTPNRCQATPKKRRFFPTPPDNRY